MSNSSPEPVGARRNIGDIAPKLADLTRDVVFGDIWERSELSRRDRSLATVWDISGDYQINRYLSTTLYYGYAWGESVMTNIYPANSNGQFAYLETNVRF